MAERRMVEISDLIEATERVFEDVSAVADVSQAAGHDSVAEELGFAQI
jgi:hypothetical protein